MLSYALSQLSEKESLVLSMYYQHDMNLKEIALVLGLTEARICQMNKKITHKIRDCLYQINNSESTCGGRNAKDFWFISGFGLRIWRLL